MVTNGATRRVTEPRTIVSGCLSRRWRSGSFGWQRQPLTSCAALFRQWTLYGQMSQSARTRDRRRRSCRSHRTSRLRAGSRLAPIPRAASRRQAARARPQEWRYTACLLSRLGLRSAARLPHRRPRARAVRRDGVRLAGRQQSRVVRLRNPAPEQRRRPERFRGADARPMVQHHRVHRRRAVRDRQQLAQSGPRTRAAERRPDGHRSTTRTAPSAPRPSAASPPRAIRGYSSWRSESASEAIQ